VIGLHLCGAYYRNQCNELQKSLEISQIQLDEMERRYLGQERYIEDLKQENSTYENMIAKLLEEEDERKDINPPTGNEEELISSGEWKIGEELLLPNLPTEFKSLTDYRVYNIQGTPHNRLQKVSYTDETGCRRYNEDYHVALGSFYSVHIGDRFEITLDTGRVFTIIMADGKDDRDTDVNNMYHPCYDYDGKQQANVLEFIIDTAVLPTEVYQYGSLHCLDEFKGDIVKITYLGRDDSGDWSTYE